MQRLAIVLVFVAACGDDPPATPDAAQADAISVDASDCAGDQLVGELLDWDSTAASFRGVNAARFALRGGSVMFTTPPNGRIDECLPTAESYVFDGTMPAAYLDTLAYFDADSVRQSAGRPLHLRAVTAARAATFYTEHALTFDASKAHVLVVVAGDKSGVSLDRAHDTTQIGTTEDMAVIWSTSTRRDDVGDFILFPNVDATSPTGTITGDLQGPHSVPLVAGTLTVVVLSWYFL